MQKSVKLSGQPEGTRSLACLIWSHEHLMWWMPDERGYTSDIREAGRYDFARAREICRDANVVTFHEQLVFVEE